MKTMRIALGVEYDGHDLFGWQAQQGLPTAQGYLEDALSKIANSPIQVTCAGRTDAGVHATGQVVHFDTSSIRNLRSWILGTNTYLPSSVCVRWAEEVDEEFHARFSATARRYRYVIYNHSIRSAVLASRVTWHHRALNAEQMHRSAQFLLGEQDFSSFRSAECNSISTMRNVQEVHITRHNDFIVMEIQANAFLHHMVRNIAGVLMEVGAGRQEPEWVRDVLLAKDRRAGAETAPPTGLYLIKVQYPDKYHFPERENKYLFL